MSPAGSRAKRGQLALVGTRYSYVNARGPSERGVHWELAEITSVTRDGEVKAYTNPAYPGDFVCKVAHTSLIYAVVDASALDRDKAVEIAREHTFPGGHIRPWESFEEAKAALRPAHPATTAGGEPTAQPRGEAAAWPSVRTHTTGGGAR
jgi:hypothetical protein